MTEAHVYTKREAFLLNSEEFAGPRYWFALACNSSRAWDRELAKALATYGDHGPAISGCGRDHFPEHVKNQLRLLARQVSEFSDEARKAKPLGVRWSTIRTLGQLVAMRYGTGFYGPQPLRLRKTKG